MVCPKIGFTSRMAARVPDREVSPGAAGAAVCACGLAQGHKAGARVPLRAGADRSSVPSARAGQAVGRHTLHPGCKAGPQGRPGGQKERTASVPERVSPHCYHLLASEATGALAKRVMCLFKGWFPLYPRNIWLSTSVP